MAFFVVFAFASLDAKRSDAFKNLATWLILELLQQWVLVRN